MKCQLYDLPEAGRTLTRGERILLCVCQAKHYPVHISRKILSNPSFLWKRLRDRFGRAFGLVDGGMEKSGSAPSLHLQPGERVRVKPLKQILASLDEGDRFEGMAFMMDEMGPYCGGVYTVRKRVDRFFDERNRELLKPRNVVILDEVLCEPHPESRAPYAGCARTCYLFWKEAWLEREDTSE